MESSYTLYYFPGNFKAAVIRAILTHAGAKWDDKRLSFEEFGTLQKSGKFEYWAVPVLEIDGSKCLSQSLAIEVYLSKKLNLLGDTDEEYYEILNILSSRSNVYDPIAQLAFPTEEQSKKLPEITKKFKDEDLPFYLAIWEKKFQAQHGKYFIGDKFTILDIVFAVTFEILTSLKATKGHGFEEVIKKKAPGLFAHVENLKKDELASYFKNVFNYEGLI
jgi:glutathione S-transferase